MALDSDDVTNPGLTEDQLAIVAKLPERFRRQIPWLMSNWPGRVGLRIVAGFQRIQIFDRAMTIAAQLFTSVFPIIIMGAALFGAKATKDAADAVELPGDASSILDDVVTSSGGIGTFGIVGVLVVLVSATSLSRALTRAYDAIWQHGRTKTKMFEAWRWLAAVFVLALAAVVARFLGAALESVPPRDFWSTSVSAVINIGIGAFIPWLLMAGRVPLRRLLPGAFLYGLAIFVTRPFWLIYLPAALESSSQRYGSIGIAFVYLTYLYVIAFALLGCAVIGYAIAIDEGLLGQFVRGETSAEEMEKTPLADPRRAPDPPEV